MKVCPHCKSTYEDWIDFCFNDGIPLVQQEGKPAGEAAAPAAPAAMSAFDAPDPRSFSAMDIPEPMALRRGAARAAAAEPTPRGVTPAATPTPTAVPTVAPVSRHEAREPVRPVDDRATEVRPAPLPDVTDLPRAAAPAAPEPAPPPSVPAPDPDAAAIAELAAAFGDPAGGDAATEPTQPARPPSVEDGKATVPMEAPWPEAAGGRSALDDEPEPARKKAGGGAGMSMAIVGIVGLAVLCAGGLGVWFMVSNKSAPAAPPVARSAPPSLPAAAPPPPTAAPEPVAPAPEPEPEPVAAAPVPEPAPEPVAAAPTPAATPKPSATPAASPAPTTAPKATATAPAAPASKPPTTPTTTPPATAPRVVTAPPPAAASDSVWGAPAAATSGMLKILTEPAGATIFVDETSKGRTPLTVELPYGVHHVRVQMAGYKTEVRDVNIRVRDLTVPFTLKPEVVTGQVNVYGPDGFKVVVDGHDMGTMPVTVQVSEGLRQFKLVGPDGKTCTTPREVKFKAAGRPETVTLECP